MISAWEARLDAFFESPLLSSVSESIKVDYSIMKRELKLAHRQLERLALCPDHRDKGTGRCVVCQAEERTRAECLAPDRRDRR